MTEEPNKTTAYPEGSAGRIMSPNAICFHKELRVMETIEKLRWITHAQNPTSYVYVIDSENHLVGVLNMRDLILADPEATLNEIMIKNVFSINAFADRNRVAEQLSNTGYFAAPVVDDENHLLGIITTHQLMDEETKRVSEGIQKMFGVGASERAFSSVKFSLSKRLPWLHVNLLAAFLAGIVVSMFEGLIAKITALAIFIPVITDQAANSASQSLAVTMRGLTMREVSKENAFKLILKETKLALISGVILGIVIGAASWLWQGNPYLGLVIGCAMTITLITAGPTGALIPIIMKSLGMDPALSSAIIVTTITQVVSIFTFLGLALLLQSYLM